MQESRTALFIAQTAFPLTIYAGAPRRALPKRCSE
jgi:hypothetical protein